MMTLSKALAAGQAKDYFQAEYTNAQESYYSEGETVKGKWFGKQAEAWTLQGDVQEEHFDRLCEGQHPLTGGQLVRHVTSHKYENRYGETVESGEHRAGWDATFSAPKSVSLAALVGGDERILQAHDRSVDVALNELEKYAQARMGGNHPAQITGRLIGAKFQHDSARPDRKTGYAAPQLHTHTVIFNLTETEDGRIKPIQPLDLYRSQRYATQVYRSVLAIELQKLGYEIIVDRRTGAPEITGFSNEYLTASSPRRDEIQREAAEMKERLAQQGIVVEDGAGLRQAAAKTDRLSKQYDQQQMRLQHLEMDAKFDKQSLHSVQQAHERGSVSFPEAEIRSRAREAVNFAIENAGEREAVVDKRTVLVDALRRNLSFTTYEAVLDEYSRNIKTGNLIRIVRNPGIEEVTTSQTVAMEQNNIRTVVAGKETQTPILEQEQLGPLLQEITNQQGITLNDAQREAVETILSSQDRIIGLEGRAGTGKTTTLSILREAVEYCGYEVEGFAPTGAAADLLGESGIRTSTLQMFVASSPTTSISEKQLYILDESSLSDTRNMFRFFDKAGPTARVLLVGDTGQHQAVEAGAPFEQFVKAGMQTASLEEIVRQQTDLRKPVEQLSMRDVIGAVKTLHDQGRITEVVDDEERLTAIANDYVSNPKRTLVISPANQERVAINSIVHRQLQEQGLVNPEDYETTILVNRQDRTGAERKFALMYVPNEDVIRYNKGSKVLEINKGDYGRVVSSDHRDNKLTVRVQDGREISYNPKRLSGVSVYKEATRQFAVGDRIQFRAPFPEAKVKNTELGIITRIEQGEFTVALSADRIITFNPEQFPHLDHGYAVTSYSSQGKTMDRVLVNAETTETDLLVNQRMAYVAVSRARFDARIYTDSVADLGDALSRRRDKTMALEALNQSSLTATVRNEGASDSETLQVRPDDDLLVGDGGNDHDHSFARLRARAIVADSDVAVAQKRLDEFERSKHLCNFEIDGEQWSLVRLDGQQRAQQRQIDYDRRAVSAYRTRLYGAINNPLKLYGLHDYKENAATAKAQIKESHRRSGDIQDKRNGVNSLLESQRAMLRGDLRQQTESAQELQYTLELEILKMNSGEAIPQPEFTGKELDRLETNAKFLRDPTMLQTVYDHLPTHYGTTAHGIERIASRANETLQSTNERLANLNEQIQTFIENREFFSVPFITANDGEQIATLRDRAKPLGEHVISGFFSDAHGDRNLLEGAFDQHYANLQEERDAIQHFVKAINTLTDSYREQIANLTPARAQVLPTGREFTESESLALQLSFDVTGPNSPATAGFHSNIGTFNDPTQGRGIIEGMATTPQPHATDHLKQVRQAIDHVVAQNGSNNETVIETGIIEAEATASETLSALI
ncbi:MAG TPA: MobF family relaxase [Pyrinomonadaceae bacterium]|nr:MobF family relaxase [Pyrinomonadaceae bacterium]